MAMGVVKVGRWRNPRHKRWTNGMEGDANWMNGKQGYGVKTRDMLFGVGETRWPVKCM